MGHRKLQGGRKRACFQLVTWQRKRVRPTIAARASKGTGGLYRNMECDPCPDTEFGEAARSKDPERRRRAFEQQLTLHGHRLFALCQMKAGPEGAPDAYQEVCLRGFDRMSSFKGKSAPSTWLWRIALNTLSQRWRTWLTHRDKLTSNAACIAESTSGGSEVETARDAHHRREAGVVYRLMRELLDPSDQDLVFLRAQDLSFEEISQAMASPFRPRPHPKKLQRRWNTAQSRLQKAYRKLNPEVCDVV